MFDVSVRTSVTTPSGLTLIFFPIFSPQILSNSSLQLLGTALLFTGLHGVQRLAPHIHFWHRTTFPLCHYSRSNGDGEEQCKSCPRVLPIPVQPQRGPAVSWAPWHPSICTLSCSWGRRLLWVGLFLVLRGFLLRICLFGTMNCDGLLIFLFCFVFLQTSFHIHLPLVPKGDVCGQNIFTMLSWKR